MGVASGRSEQDVGVASGWNQWMWLEYMSVVSGCCCYEVLYTDFLIIIISYFYSTCITAVFWKQ